MDARIKGLIRECKSLQRQVAELSDKLESLEERLNEPEAEPEPEPKGKGKRKGKPEGGRDRYSGSLDEEGDDDFDD